MALDSSSELSAFHAFVGGQLQAAGELHTPEECLEMWRSLYPQSNELAESITATKAALNDMAAGDEGRSARGILAAARQRHITES
jgi:hypothetical protein